MNTEQSLSPSKVTTISGKTVAGPADLNEYWEKRKNHDLYRLMLSISKGMFPDAVSAIDIGCHTSGLIVEMDWIANRLAADLEPFLTKHWAEVDTVKFVQGDAFDIEFEQKFDLVISNQVIEHVDRPKEFVDKLLSLGTGLIISTTYETPAGLIAGHVQDPISMEKFRSWFPVEFDCWTICHHPTNKKISHVIAVISANHPARPQSAPSPIKLKTRRPLIRRIRRRLSTIAGKLKRA